MHLSTVLQSCDRVCESSSRPNVLSAKYQQSVSSANRSVSKTSSYH